MAFRITTQQDIDNSKKTILTDGGSIEIGSNLTVDEDRKLNASMSREDLVSAGVAFQDDLNDYLTTQAFGEFRAEYNGAQSAIGTRFTNIEGLLNNKLNTSDLWTTLGYASKEAFEEAIQDGGLTQDQIDALNNLTEDKFLTSESLLNLISNDEEAGAELRASFLELTKNNVEDSKIINVVSTGAGLASVASAVAASNALTSKYATTTDLQTAEGRITTNENSISSLTQTVNEKVSSSDLTTTLSSYYDKDTVDGKIETAKTEARAGLALQSDLEAANATLSTTYKKNDTDNEAIISLIAGEIGSKITIDANQIDFKGENDYPLYLDFQEGEMGGERVKHSTLTMVVPEDSPIHDQSSDAFPNLINLGIDTSSSTQYNQANPYLELNGYVQNNPNGIYQVKISPFEINTQGADVIIRREGMAEGASIGSPNILKIHSASDNANSYIQLNEGVPITIIDADGQQTLTAANISSFPITINGQEYEYAIVNGLIVKLPNHEYPN